MELGVWESDKMALFVCIDFSGADILGHGFKYQLRFMVFKMLDLRHMLIK